MVPEVVPSLLGISPPAHTFATIHSKGEKAHPEALPLRSVSANYFIKRWFSYNASCHSRRSSYNYLSYIAVSIQQIKEELFLLDSRQFAVRKNQKLGLNLAIAGFSEVSNP